MPSPPQILQLRCGSRYFCFPYREEKGSTSVVLQHHAALNGEPQGVEEDHRRRGEGQRAGDTAAAIREPQPSSIQLFLWWHSGHSRGDRGGGKAVARGEGQEMKLIEGLKRRGWPLPLLHLHKHTHWHPEEDPSGSPHAEIRHCVNTLKLMQFTLCWKKRPYYCERTLWWEPHSYALSPHGESAENEQSFEDAESCYEIKTRRRRKQAGENRAIHGYVAVMLPST